jgi:DMSO/TMAO reductase YedYZ molybdopterin-dependent catalytic subunit
VGDEDGSGDSRLTRKKIEWARTRRGSPGGTGESQAARAAGDPPTPVIGTGESQAARAAGDPPTPVNREEGVASRLNPAAASARPRLPPGQRLVTGFPVLDLGVHPEIGLDVWALEIDGLVEQPAIWSWSDFVAQPQIDDVSDFHCVTSWSTFDNRWTGVAFRQLLAAVRPKPDARFVLLSSYDGYTTNLPLSVLDQSDVLIAHRWNGAPLAQEHGGPARLVVPRRYGWKSAKWLKAIRFLAEDRLGFWEVRGYSNTADPWTDDRYA